MDTTSCALGALCKLRCEDEESLKRLKDGKYIFHFLNISAEVGEEIWEHPYTNEQATLMLLRTTSAEAAFAYQDRPAFSQTEDSQYEMENVLKDFSEPKHSIELWGSMLKNRAISKLKLDRLFPP